MWIRPTGETTNKKKCTMIFASRWYGNNKIEQKYSNNCKLKVFNKIESGGDSEGVVKMKMEVKVRVIGVGGGTDVG